MPWEVFCKGTVELAIPLGLPPELGIRWSVFSDVGSVWHTGNKVIPSNPILSNNQRFRASAGVGVTWRSPFGPIGVSLAQPFVRVKKVDRTEQFRVNFGTSF
jgi:outer membrane protein insertion porin family